MSQCCAYPCCAILAALVAVVVALPYVLRHKPDLDAAPDALRGKVAVVTGASRGIGAGIAIGLGEFGCTVYVTGRTLKATQGQAGSLEDTCAAVEAKGGRCIPVQADSNNDTDLEAVFERVLSEQDGNLDILVNNAFAAVTTLPKRVGMPFWEQGLDMWDVVNAVGLRSHYQAAVLAARAMARRGKGGLIINVSSFGGLSYIFNVAYGIGKAAMDRMAADMAVELRTENVTVVSLWPGGVSTENFQEINKGGGFSTKLKAHRGLPPGAAKMDFATLFGTPLAETPFFSGRAVAALARDRNKFSLTGKVVLPSLMAKDYGFVDERGVRTPMFPSLKFLAGPVLPDSLKKLPEGPLPWEMDLFWNRLPDGDLPLGLLKYATSSPLF